MAWIRRRDRLLRVVGAAIAAQLIVLTGCTPGRQGSVSSNPDLIERGEIEAQMATGTTNLYDLIQRIRPRWLESRGDRSLRLETVILVYHNQQRLGGLEVLRDLRPDNVFRIRRLDSARAGLLPGAADDHVEAAIVFETLQR